MANSASPTPARPRIEPATLLVTGILVALGAAWLLYVRLNAAPTGGIGWGPLDSIMAAQADRQANRPAPTFILEDTSGQTFDLADYRGQIVLVNFWATWCEPCRAELRELDDLVREFGPSGFRVLAVNLLESAATVRRFESEMQLGFPLLVDPAGDVYKDYSVQGLPSNYLVDHAGTIRDVRLGVVTRGYLRSRLPGLFSARDRAAAS